MAILRYGSTGSSSGWRCVIRFGRIVSVLVTAVLLSLSPSVLAQNLVGRVSSGLFGIKAGMISRMNMRGGLRLHSEIGSSAQVFVDFPKGKGFYISTAFDFYYIEINRSNQIMIEPSIGFKRSFHLRRANMILRPTGSIGFAYLADMGDLPSSNFLTFKFSVEAHFKIDAKKAWVGELGLFHAPTGSNGRLDVSLGPGVMLRWGLAFR